MHPNVLFCIVSILSGKGPSFVRVRVQVLTMLISRSKSDSVGPVFFFFFLALRMPPLFLLGIGKTREAMLIRTYFSLYIGLMYKSLQLHA